MANLGRITSRATGDAVSDRAVPHAPAPLRSGKTMLDKNPPKTAPQPTTSQTVIYDVSFWLAFLSNTLASAASSLLCRYADFATFLGADEYRLGWIVGMGMVGSLVMRFSLGESIDRFGARRIWITTSLAATVACLLHLGISDATSPAIYLARIFYNLAMAGIFSASMTLISARAPKERLAEVVGIYGAAGFAGVLLGAPLADLLFPSGITSTWSAQSLFLIAAALCLASVPLAMLVPDMPRGESPNADSGKPADAKVGQRRTQLARNRRAKQEPSTWQVILRYSPVPVIVAGIVAGAGLSVPTTFLPRFVASFNVHSISGFFFLYAATAVVLRAVLLQKLQRFGLHRVIVLGIAILALSQLLFWVVRSPWELIIPGFVFGWAQALLFPSIVALGSSAFPARHRGLGTTIMMATFDAGLLIGGPLAGFTIRLAEQYGWPRYPTMFGAMAILLLAFDAYFFLMLVVGRQKHRRASIVRPQPAVAAPELPVPQPVIGEYQDGQIGPAPANIPRIAAAVAISRHNAGLMGAIVASAEPKNLAAGVLSTHLVTQPTTTKPSSAEPVANPAPLSG